MKDTGSDSRGVPDEPMQLGRFLGQLEASLAEVSSSHEFDAALWETSPSYRTHRMLGAHHSEGRSTRQDCILQDTMRRLGYSVNENELGRDGFARLYGFEWQKIDLVAATSPGKWGDCVWQGRYRLDLALEVENNPSEFTLHMRGLLDTHALHRVCIFYTGKSREEVLDTEVWTGVGKEMTKVGDWRWPPANSQGWTPGVSAELIAVFVSLKNPHIVGAFSWFTGAPRLVPTSVYPSEGGSNGDGAVSAPRTPPA